VSTAPDASNTAPASPGAHPPFHLALDLSGQPCLVVGAGPVAARKAAALVECGAEVTVVAPEVSSAMAELAARHPPPALVIEQREYRPGEIVGSGPGEIVGSGPGEAGHSGPGEAGHYRLVMTATGIGEVDLAVFEDAEASRTLVNAADEPDACAFLMPAVWRSGDVSVAVSTGGVSPFLAGWVRRRIAAALGSEVAVLARFVGEARSRIRAHGTPTEGLGWEHLVAERLWPLVQLGDDDTARAEIERFVSESTSMGGSSTA
jgi:siroheme synthase (precorrin-2 oxidase/ferrochelatase)